MNKSAYSSVVRAKMEKVLDTRVYILSSRISKNMLIFSQNIKAFSQWLTLTFKGRFYRFTCTKSIKFYTFRLHYPKINKTVTNILQSSRPKLIHPAYRQHKNLRSSKFRRPNPGSKTEINNNAKQIFNAHRLNQNELI